MEKERFADPGTHLQELATHFVVHCPRCQGKALVGTDERLTCTACFYVEKPGKWYGAMTAYVSVKCRECHAPIRRTETTDGQWQKIDTTCPACGDTCAYEATMSKHPMHNGLVTDRVFGLPLWLQKSFRDELFWAYNYEHLDMLRQYISAKLRERGIGPRSTQSKNSGMISRLPTFIKKAANREALLKLVDQLATKES
jgi:ribosomal protein S27AE